jgi:hypothetical protein
MTQLGRLLHFLIFASGILSFNARVRMEEGVRFIRSAIVAADRPSEASLRSRSSSSAVQTLLRRFVIFASAPALQAGGWLRTRRPGRGWIFIRSNPSIKIGRVAGVNRQNVEVTGLSATF